MNKDNKCILCLENIAKSYIINCNHYVFCNKCMVSKSTEILNMKKCPLCRGNIDDIYAPFNACCIDKINKLYNVIIDLKDNNDLFLKKINESKPIKNIEFNFGKYNGLTIQEIQKRHGNNGLSYIKWISEKYKQQQEDMIHLNNFLNKYHYK